MIPRNCLRMEQNNDAVSCLLISRTFSHRSPIHAITLFVALFQQRTPLSTTKHWVGPERRFGDRAFSVSAPCPGLCVESAIDTDRIETHALVDSNMFKTIVAFSIYADLYPQFVQSHGDTLTNCYGCITVDHDFLNSGRSPRKIVTV